MVSFLIPSGVHSIAVLVLALLYSQLCYLLKEAPSHPTPRLPHLKDAPWALIRGAVEAGDGVGGGCREDRLNAPCGGRAEQDQDWRVPRADSWGPDDPTGGTPPPGARSALRCHPLPAGSGRPSTRDVPGVTCTKPCRTNHWNVHRPFDALSIATLPLSFISQISPGSQLSVMS